MNLLSDEFLEELLDACASPVNDRTDGQKVSIERASATFYALAPLLREWVGQHDEATFMLHGEHHTFRSQIYMDAFAMQSANTATKVKELLGGGV